MEKNKELLEALEAHRAYARILFEALAKYLPKGDDEIVPPALYAFQIEDDRLAKLLETLINNA